MVLFSIVHKKQEEEKGGEEEVDYETDTDILKKQNLFL